MASQAKPGRRYGFACLGCRRKKIRCDGEKPQCRNCAKCDESCAYKSNEVLVASLYDDLEKLRRRVHELEDTVRRLTLNHDGGCDCERLLSTVIGGPYHQSPPDTLGSTSIFDGDSAHNSPASLRQAEPGVDEHGEVQCLFSFSLALA